MLIGVEVPTCFVSEEYGLAFMGDVGSFLTVDEAAVAIAGLCTVEELRAQVWVYLHEQDVCGVVV